MTTHSITKNNLDAGKMNRTAMLHWKGTPGSLVGEEADLLFTAMRYAGTLGNVLEVGCEFGKSTGVIAYAMPPDRFLYCVDPWEDDKTPNDFPEAMPCKIPSVSEEDMDTPIVKLFDRYTQHIKSRIRVLRGFFAEQVEVLKEIKYSAIFLDAGHLYEDLIVDIPLAAALNPELLLIHDYGCCDWPGVEEAANELLGPALTTRGTLGVWRIGK